MAWLLARDSSVEGGVVGICCGLFHECWARACLKRVRLDLAGSAPFDPGAKKDRAVMLQPCVCQAVEVVFEGVLVEVAFPFACEVAF